jgi:8-oxo-dGTP diphosphatase
MSATPTTFYAGGIAYDAATRAVLLHLRDSHTKINPNLWAFFGGGSEPGETPQECFIREFEEETGQRLPAESCRPLRDYFNDALNTHRYVFYTMAPVTTQAIRLTEGAGFGWIPLDQVERYPLTPRAAEDLAFFKEHLATL